MATQLSNQGDSEFFSVDQLLDACREQGVSISDAAKAVDPSGNFPDLDDFLSSSKSQRDHDPAPDEIAVSPQVQQNVSIESHNEIHTPEYVPEPSRKKGKQHRKRVINFKRRMHGEEYIGYSTLESENRKRTTPQNAPREARKMGPTCSLKACGHRATRHCGEFSNVDRQNLFDQFWRKMNWEEKRTYVLSLIDHREPLKRSKNAAPDFRKGETFLYYLKLGGVRKQVCRQMFLNTLGVGRSQIRSWLTRTPKLERKDRDPDKLKGGDAGVAKQYLEDLPKLPSHYCRQHTSKLYLEPIFRTKSQLYNLYVEYCKERNVQPVSASKFNRLFEEMSLAIHQPKKDQCDTCCAYECRSISDEVYKAHISAKDNARNEKSADKKCALEDQSHVLTMDVQRVLLSPCLNASALYYRTKLVVHNFTVYDLKTKHAKCFLWDETEADLQASVFASCIVQYISDNFKDKLPVIIWSDGCTNQNRNATLSNALSNLAVTQGRVITQKYLEKGHTQMEVDSVHANIERRLKNKSIYSPFEYIEVCNDARSIPSRYEVQYMNHGDFLDYSGSKSMPMRYTSIRPGNKTGEPVVTDLKQIRYNVDGTIDFKLQHSDEWARLPRNPKNVDPVMFPKLFKSTLPLQKRKYQDLMDLLHVIPEEFRKYYKSLPVK